MLAIRSRPRLVSVILDLGVRRMDLPPLQCDLRYQADFLTEEEAAGLFSEIVSGFDVKNKTIKMFDGTHHICETGCYLFADPDLTSFDALPEVWGARSPWTASLARVRDRILQESGIRSRVASLRVL